MALRTPPADDETAALTRRAARSSRAALERYLHYYTRYTNHNNSLKFETEAKAKMEAKIKDMEQIGDNTWMDCLYLNEASARTRRAAARAVLRPRARPPQANEALHECRYALQYTYVYAFYLPSAGNYRDHFEMQQMELERQTEEARPPASARLCAALTATARAQLAELLERDAKDIHRMEVVHCFQMAKKRLRNLVELCGTEEAVRVAQQNAAESSAAGSSSSAPH